MIPSFGAHPSPYDIRTFAYPTKAYAKSVGGTKYNPSDIEHQAKVGICTAISLTQNARKALGIKFSADFQYLIQKKYYDKNWDEGSSLLNSLKTAKNIGLLPVENWTFTTQTDRERGYDWYVQKLKTIPQSEIDRLILIANQHKIMAYASVPVQYDSVRQAIDESKAGILSRFSLGQEWYTDTKGNVTWDKNYIEPLRPPKNVISGHAITESNYNGDSVREANTWGPEWADGGTAYRMQSVYQPTESWAVYYDDVHPDVQAQLEQRVTLIGQALDLVQKIINLLKIK